MILFEYLIFYYFLPLSSFKKLFYEDKNIVYNMNKLNNESINNHIAFKTFNFDLVSAINS